MNWRKVAPTGPGQEGTMARPTIETGWEAGSFADIHAPDIDGGQIGELFQGIWSDDAHHFVGGRLYIRADTRAPVATILTAEVRVFGEVAGIKDLIVTGVVSSGSGPLLAQLSGYQQSFVQLSVDARKLINGIPSDLPVPELRFAIAGRLFR